MSPPKKLQRVRKKQTSRSKIIIDKCTEISSKDIQQLLSSTDDLLASEEEMIAMQVDFGQQDAPVAEFGLLGVVLPHHVAAEFRKGFAEKVVPGDMMHTEGTTSVARCLLLEQTNEVLSYICSRLGPIELWLVSSVHKRLGSIVSLKEKEINRFNFRSADRDGTFRQIVAGMLIT